MRRGFLVSFGGNDDDPKQKENHGNPLQIFHWKLEFHSHVFLFLISYRRNFSDTLYVLFYDSLTRRCTVQIKKDQMDVKATVNGRNSPSTASKIW